MIKTLAAGAAILAALVPAAKGCEKPGTGEVVHAKVCVDAATPGHDVYTRLADSVCKSGQAGARWRYYPGGVHIPRVGKGAPRSTGSFDEPSGSLVYIPREGGTGNDAKAVGL